MNDLKLLKLFTNNSLSWESGYDYIFYSLNKLVLQNIKIVSDIVSDGPLYAALMYSIEDLELKKFVSIHLTKSISANLDKFLSECDVYLNYSFKPSNPYYNKLATKNGKYIITTEAATDRIYSRMFKVEPRDVIQLENTIKHIYQEVINA